MSQVRAVILTEIISPYRVPVLNVVASDPDIDLWVLFFAETEKRRQWIVPREQLTCKHQVLPGWVWQRGDAEPFYLNSTVPRELMRTEPDVVICDGCRHPAALLSLGWAKVYRKRFALWSESTLLDHRGHHWLVEVYKRWFVRQCSEYLAFGTASRQYLLSLGAESSQIWMAPNAVDNDHFHKASREWRKRKLEFKRSRGYPSFLFLYVGRLLNDKGVADLLEAFRSLEGGSGVGLVLVGDGSDRAQYERYVQYHGLTNVWFTGFVQQDELPRYYGIADCLVFPSHSDPWGLVVNEAMASKLPVIASHAPGATADLVREGQNGFIYQAGNVSQLIDRMNRVLKMTAADRLRMGRRSFQIVQAFSTERCAQGFANLIKRVRDGSGGDAS